MGRPSSDKLLDDYELGASVASDSHTITYRATHRRLGRPVRLKVLKPGVEPDAELRRAFDREARALQELAHPLLTQLHDYLADADQLALIYLDDEGPSLEEVLERCGKLSSAAALAIAVEVARALAVIHRRGIVHASLTARSVELTSEGSIRLHGFAAVRLEGRSAAPLPSPADMAPEQLVGDREISSTDVFLLGLLLYRMLTGQRPFAGGSKAGGVSQLVRHEPPPPLTRYAPKTGAKVERIIMRCLSKQPADRYPDAVSAASALIRALRAQSSLPTELLITKALAEAGLADDLPQPTEPGVHRGAGGPQRLLPRVLGPLAIAAVVVLLGVVIWQAVRDPPQLDTSTSRGIEQRPARLRILAHPWAEIHLDGELIDITPIGKPLEVAPGRHTVVFKHPQAPDVQRDVEVIAGQTIMLDVELAVVRPDAGPPTAPSGSGSAAAEAESP